MLILTVYIISIQSFVQCTMTYCFYSGTTCLGNLELQALQVILSENIIMDLKKEGLHFEHLDETCITIEDIQYHLKRKGYIREAQQLKSELQSSKLSLCHRHVDTCSVFAVISLH